jgi:hypothetical protein
LSALEAQRITFVLVAPEKWSLLRESHPPLRFFKAAHNLSQLRSEKWFFQPVMLRRPSLIERELF